MPEPSRSNLYDVEMAHYKTVRSKKMAMFNTSSTELVHLFFSWLAISYAFAIMLGWNKLNRMPTSSEVFGPFIADLIMLSLITVGISFIAHEMGHKFVAQRYGAWAEFRMSVGMLLLAIFMAWRIGILFAAPGAVQISRLNISRDQYGKIAASGPLMNLFLAFVFMPLVGESGIIGEIGRLGIIINLLLAGFNMLPISVLDGRKVLAWNGVVYVVLFMFIILVGMFSIPMLL